MDDTTNDGQQQQWSMESIRDQTLTDSIWPALILCITCLERKLKDIPVRPQQRSAQRDHRNQLR